MLSAFLQSVLYASLLTSSFQLLFLFLAPVYSPGHYEFLDTFRGIGISLFFLFSLIVF